MGNLAIKVNTKPTNSIDLVHPLILAIHGFQPADYLNQINSVTIFLISQKDFFFFWQSKKKKKKKVWTVVSWSQCPEVDPTQITWYRAKQETHDLGLPSVTYPPIYKAVPHFQHSLVLVSDHPFTLFPPSICQQGQLAVGAWTHASPWLAI